MSSDYEKKEEVSPEGWASYRSDKKRKKKRVRADDLQVVSAERIKPDRSGEVDKALKEFTKGLNFGKDDDRSPGGDLTKQIASQKKPSFSEKTYAKLNDDDRSKLMPSYKEREAAQSAKNVVSDKDIKKHSNTNAAKADKELAEFTKGMFDPEEEEYDKRKKRRNSFLSLSGSVARDRVGG